MNDLRGRSIDLNADLGEGCPWDELLLDRVSSASVSCGAHAGDPGAIRATLRAAWERGVVVGAHPGYSDRASFGRREQALDTADIVRLILEQCQALSHWAAPLGVAIRFLKPHGALYNQAQRDPPIAAGVVEAAQRLGHLPLLGLPGSCVETAAREAGIRFIAEGFADRRYTAEGRLVPRSESGAMLEDPGEVAAHVRALVAQGVATTCIHGDSPNAVALADVVCRAAREAGVSIAPFLARLADPDTIAARRPQE
jgi:UPF0271 protein